MKIAHVALWTRDLSAQAAFWQDMFGAVSHERYISKNRPGFESCFIHLAQGPTLELMTLPVLEPGLKGQERIGWAHIAIDVGSEQEVDRLADRAARMGILVSAGRTTGDGFYEAVIRDPDSNLIELVA